MRPIDRKILDYLTRNPGVTCAQIREDCNIPKARLSAVLRRLRDRKRINPQYSRVLLTNQRVRRESPDEQRVIRLLRARGAMTVRDLAQIMHDPQSEAGVHHQYKDVEIAVTQLTRVGLVSRARAIWPISR